MPRPADAVVGILAMLDGPRPEYSVAKGIFPRARCGRQHHGRHPGDGRCRVLEDGAIPGDVRRVRRSCAPRSGQTPILLVPPNDLDIINSADGFKLTCGPVLAAVDLSQDSRPQLEAASRMAQLAGQGLQVITVASDPMSDHDAAEQLRDRTHGLTPVKPTALIVRRGNVAEEISRCAVAEGSGLVVMGLREPSRGRPGVIASAVLHTGRAFVLAVPAG